MLDASKYTDCGFYGWMALPLSLHVCHYSSQRVEGLLVVGVLVKHALLPLKLVNSLDCVSSLCLGRITVLAAICLTQAFMMWKFINFQLRRWREQAQTQTLKKKQAPAKSKSKKEKSERGGWGLGGRGGVYTQRLGF